MKNGFSEFSVLDAMKNHPVSAQIDEVFRQVIKPEKKKPKTQPEEVVQDHGGVRMSDNGDELEIKLSDDEPAPPESLPQDDGLDLNLADDQGLDLNSDTQFEAPATGGESYGDLALDAEAGDFSLGEVDSGNLDSAGVATEFGQDFEADPGMDLGDLSPGTEDQFDPLPPAVDDFNSMDLSADMADQVPDDPHKLVLSASDLDGGKAFDLSEPPPFEEAMDEAPSFSVDEELEVADGANALLASEEDLDLSNLGGTDDEELNISFGSEDVGETGEADLSADAKEKLKEIDAIMVSDASQINLKAATLDEPLVSDDLDLGSINFGAEEEPQVIPEPEKKEEPKKKKKEKEKEPAPAQRDQKSAAPAKEIVRERPLGQELKEISQAYSGEMERMQATISNLRMDREELLAKIQKLEEEKVLQGRQSLSMRAELDERKIELTIIRRKLNEEIAELRDQMKLHEEKRLILEEKNKILSQELERAAQKSKIDVKKVIMRERELEQKLELLKADAETQIRNRDLKILELKRKIDGMEFDMESISQQEKRSVESRFELEDKLEKAIKTLRSAITVLEDETDRTNALNALKKNIDI